MPSPLQGGSGSGGDGSGDVGVGVGSNDTSIHSKDSIHPKATTVVRVALCQFHVGNDKSVNLQTCARFLDRAAAEGAQVVVLPEIWNSPYATAAFASYAEPIPTIGSGSSTGSIGSSSTPDTGTVSQSPSVDLIRTKAVQHNMWIVGGSIPERDVDGNIFNTCIVYSPEGTMVAKHRKVHLFDIDIPGGITFLESDTLSPGSTLSSFITPWCTIGVGICYDIRFPEYALLLAKTCQILVYPGAFNMVTGPAHWELLARARAVDNQCFVLTASPARSAAPPPPPPPPTSSSSISSTGDAATTTTTTVYPHYTAWGHSTVVAPWGNVLATTDETEGLVVTDLDLTEVDNMRRNIPVRNQKRDDLYQLVQPPI